MRLRAGCGASLRQRWSVSPFTCRTRGLHLEDVSRAGDNSSAQSIGMPRAYSSTARSVSACDLRLHHFVWMLRVQTSRRATARVPRPAPRQPGRVTPGSRCTAVASWPDLANRYPSTAVDRRKRGSISIPIRASAMAAGSRARSSGLEQWRQSAQAQDAPAGFAAWSRPAAFRCTPA